MTVDRNLKRQARLRMELTPGLSYCQALSQMAKERGTSIPGLKREDAARKQACTVCGGPGPLQTAASACMSFRFTCCATCKARGAEPPRMLAAGLRATRIDSPALAEDHLAPEALAILKASRERAGLSEDEFWTMVRDAA